MKHHEQVSNGGPKSVENNHFTFQNANNNKYINITFFEQNIAAFTTAACRATQPWARRRPSKLCP